MTDEEEKAAPTRDDDEIEGAEEAFQVANEFALVVVRKVYTHNGERLELRSPKLGEMIRLDPLELESLTWQTTDTFSKFLEKPFGH